MRILRKIAGWIALLANAIDQWTADHHYYGNLLVFEGTEFAGKTSIANALVALLEARNAPVFQTREPRRVGIGGYIRKELNRVDGLKWPAPLFQVLYVLDRFIHLTTRVRPAIRRGELVVCDRYFPSTIVCGDAEGLPVWYTRFLNIFFPWPELIIVLDPSEEAINARLQKRLAGQVEEGNPAPDIEQRFDHKAVWMKGKYLRFAARYESRVVVLDSSSDDTEANVDAVIKVLVEKGILHKSLA